MNTNDPPRSKSRRNFLGTITTGAAVAGLSAMAPGLSAFAAEQKFNPVVYGDPEEMFKKINGKHRVVFDATRPHEIMPFAWPKVFLMTNEMTGTPNKDCSVVVVLRHDAIPYAFESKLWEKYKFGELFEAHDPKTNKPALRNPFWQPQPGDFTVPGVGNVEIGINQLQANGVQFCVCNMAMTVYSAVVAQQMNLKAEDVKKEWDAGLLPGIQVVPSGVWALGRAQEKQCAYIFAG